MKYSDFVELSRGKVFIKPLTNKVLNKAYAISNVVGVGIKNAVFLDYCERKMTQLYFWQWGSLTIKDGNLLREKIKEMLKADDVIKDEVKVEETSDEFDANKISSADLQWFNVQKNKQVNG